MKKILFCLLLFPAICLAANDDISDRPELGTAVNTDSILAVNAGNTAGDRLARILFQGTAGYVLTGNGTWYDLTSALSGKQATLVSATNIKTVNSTSLLGSGDVAVEPVQTAASQAEAEAGTEAAIRSFSPLRTSQAIVALGANALITDTGDYFTGTTINATLQEIGEDLAGAINLTVDGTTIEQTGTSPNITISVKSGVFQAADADLTTYAGITPAANTQSLLGAANYAAMRGLLDLEADTDFASYGKNPVVTASKATTYTIGTDSVNELFGGTVYVTSTTTITAPAVAVGQNFCVTTIGDIAVSLDVNASDKMILDGVTLADGDQATNTSKSGDTICCQYYSADGFYCWSGTVLGGHWTDGN